MTDQFDQAQELEERFRNRAIAQQLKPRQSETPNEDEHGNRYCLSCGIEIPEARIKATPLAVRCVSCQSRKEPKWNSI